MKPITTTEELIEFTAFHGIPFKSDVAMDSLMDRIKNLNDPRRKYHTWDHIETFIMSFGTIKDINQRKEYFLGAVFHDSIMEYKPDDVDRSLANFNEWWSLYRQTEPSVDPSIIRNFINNSTDYSACEIDIKSRNEVLFAIDDLSVLSSDKDTYNLYVLNILKEIQNFTRLSMSEILTARINFLSNLLLNANYSLILSVPKFQTNVKNEIIFLNAMKGGF